MAFKFSRPIEYYSKMVTSEMLKDAFEEYGFEVVLNDTFTVDSNAFTTFFLKNPSFTKAVIESYENDLDNLLKIASDSSAAKIQMFSSLHHSIISETVKGYELNNRWASLFKNTVKDAHLKAGKIANPTFVFANIEEDIPEYHSLRIDELTIPGVV